MPDGYERERDDRGYEPLGEWFYFFMSLLIAVIVVYGFAQRAEMQFQVAAMSRVVSLWK